VAIAVTSLGSGSASSSAASRRTATVSKGVVQSTVSGNGTLEPAEQAELSFGASGEVTNVYVKAGDEVKKGEVLARIDASSARASSASARAELYEAEEALEAALEAEEEAEDEETAYEGSGATTVLTAYVADATTIAEAGEVPGATGGGEEPAAGGEGESATKERKAVEREQAKLEKEKAAFEKEKAAAAKEAAQGGGEAAQGTGSTGTGEEATEEAATSGSGGGEAEAQSGGVGGAESVPTAEANLQKARLTVRSARQELRETTLRAPISATVTAVAGTVGESVSGGSSGGGGTSEAGAAGATGGESSGSAFISLAQVHRLKMEVSFSESDIGKVRKGQTATVAIDALEGTELAGEVTKVSVLSSEGSTGVVEYPATILLTQSAKGLRAGMSASAEVVVEQVKNAIAVSSEALSGKSVTVEEDGKEVTKSVTTGLEGDETTQVISGLQVGDTVVLPEVTVATGTTGGSEGESKESATSGFPGAGAGGFTGGPPSGGGFGGGAP
jgi:multidrug efflux pump subunit AcrA (membrane-fusion protein)